MKKRKEISAQNDMRNKANKVANHANERHSSPTKPERRLAGRIKDYGGIKDKEGFRQPGSLQ